jgi:hypothetical protein
MCHPATAIASRRALGEVVDMRVLAVSSLMACDAAGGPHSEVGTS